RMVKLYRFFAENGADLIVGHHPHCYSGYELYNGVPIFYSLGNFLFTLPSKYKSWYTGLILQLNIEKSVGIKWKLIPIFQSIENYSLTLANDQEYSKIMDDISVLSKIIQEESLLDTKWNSFLSERSNAYLDIFSPTNIISQKL